MTKTIQITNIAQAIELLKKAKEEYRELEKENARLRALIPSKSKMPEGFEKLFGSFKK